MYTESVPHTFGTSRSAQDSFVVVFSILELTRAKLRSNHAEPSNVTYVRYVKRGAVHAMAELTIEPNPKTILAPHLGQA